MPRAKLPVSNGSKLTTKLRLQTSQLAVAFRHIKPSWRHYLEYVESAARDGDKDMAKYLGAYHGLTRREQATISPEQLCDMSGVPADRLFGAVCTYLWRNSNLEANLITAINFPKVIERTAKSALTKGGVKDREMFHRATGFIKTPAGPSIVVNNNNTPKTLIAGGGSVDTRPSVLPSMEDEALSMEEALTIPLLSAPIDVAPVNE